MKDEGVSGICGVIVGLNRVCGLHCAAEMIFTRLALSGLFSSQVLEKFTSRLTQMRLLNHRNLHSLTKYQIILAREQFRRNPPPHVQVQ